MSPALATIQPLLLLQSLSQLAWPKLCLISTTIRDRSSCSALGGKQKKEEV